MKTLYHKDNYPPQFNNVPIPFRFYLNGFNRFGSISPDIFQQIETALLEALNNQEISSGYSPLDPSRIRPNIKELIVWIGVYFSIFIKEEDDESFSIINPMFDDTIVATEGFRLICFENSKRYDLVWSDQLEDYIKNCKGKINIDIIEDYKEILSLITHFNKETIQKIGHLPYLGETKDNGDCFLLDRKIYRPEYERIKADPTISIGNCICVLLGIDDVDLFEFVGYELSRIKDHKMGIMDMDPDMKKYRISTRVPGPYNDFVVMNYEKEWRDIFSFVDDFISNICGKSGPAIININDGCQIDCSKKYNLTDLSPFGETIENCKIKTLDFLNWMQENGYPIPEELAIENNERGETICAGHSSKTKQTTIIPVPQGTKWYQIHFRIVSPNRIETTTPDGMKPYHPDDLGFTPKIWETFKQFACEGKEFINADRIDVSRLRKLLKRAFPSIKDNPILNATSVKTSDSEDGKLKNIDAESLSKPTGYKAEFHITEA